MSGRLMRKVLKEQDAHLVDPEIQQGQLNGDESESPDSSTPSYRNPFDLLNDDDDDDDEHAQETDSKIDDETLSGDTNEQESSAVKSTVGTAPSFHQKSKKKKKKRSKETSFSSTDTVEKPLDLILESLSVDVGSSSSQPNTTKAKAANLKVNDNVVKQCESSILQVNPKFLNAENELKRIFGSKVVNSLANSNQSGSSRQQRGVRRANHIPRKTFLVSPLDHWPRWDGSLSMEFLETKDGLHFFRYVHSSAYGPAQRGFEAAKAIHDLNSIAGILAYHPYHVDSLLTMAGYYKFAGEHQMAADLIARCLYALECAWHRMFTPLQGNCQLKFSEETNKPLFTALFTHMKNLDRRGCHRSAFEVCKLLLSLDSDNPMGALFCIDYYSIRAGQYVWLERFSEEYNRDNSLWLFPNFSYSLAICRSYLEQDETPDKKTGKSTSTELMKQALMLHPSVLKKLVEKVPLKEQIWTNMLKHAFFKSEKTGTPTTDHLINIYVERSHLVWKLPELQKLLRESTQLVIEALENNPSEGKDWACVRKEAFSSEKNEYAHLLVSEFSDTVPTAPPDELQNFMVNPGMREAAPDVNRGANLGVVHRELDGRSVLAVLAESALPFFHFGGGEDGRGGENGHRPDNEGQ